MHVYIEIHIYTRANVYAVKSNHLERVIDVKDDSIEY